jgi:glutathione reductase (NADPH)
MADYDFLIIGAGTGGMAAAKKAANYGMKVAVIEKEKEKEKINISYS